MATFPSLADDPSAETIALRFTSNGLSAVTSNNIVVNPAAASKLVISTEPSPSATAGQAFGTQPVILEEDPFGNLEKNDNSTAVTVSLNSGSGPLQGNVSTTVVGGVATFSSLADTLAETITLRFTSGSLAPAISSAITVVPAGNQPPPNSPTPMITGETVTYAPQKSKKSKKTVSGFQLFFSVPMNQTSLQNHANYTMVAKVKKGKKTTPASVSITSISASSNSVILTFSSKQKFAQGGTLTINAPASGGISSLAGVSLSSGYTFTILPNAKNISESG